MPHAHDTDVISPAHAGALGAGRWPSCLGGSLVALVMALAPTPAPADEPAVARPETPTPAFQPGEISVEEPIPVRFGGRFSPPASLDASPPSDDPLAAAAPTATPSAAVPGSGWIGLGVAESNVPGRWRIDEVVSGGPAARANIAVGDELRAVNGVTLTSAAEVTQAFTSLASGQDVRVAVARADQVTDVVLRAEPRPAVRVDQPAVPAPAAPTASTTAPATTAPATTVPAASVPAWQAAEAPSAPPAAAGSRFGTVPAPEPMPVAAPTPAALPRAAIAPATLPAPLPRAAGGRPALGVRSVPVDPATQSRFKLASPAGAYVVGVVHDLPAARAGVPPGSVIVALDDHPVRSPVELTELVTRGPVDKPVTVQFVLPGGEAKRAAVVLQSLDAPLERALTEGPEQAASPPALQPGPVPRRAERLAGGEGPVRAEIRAEIRSEIGALRSRLERLERLLDPRDDGR